MASSQRLDQRLHCRATRSARRVVALLALAAVVEVGALALAAPTAQAEPAAAVVDAFVGGLNARDLERVAATLADDVTAFVPGAQAERVEGKPALLAILRAFITDAAAGGGATAIVPVDRQLVRHGDVAIVTFHVRGEAVLARRSFIVARSDGAWRIVHFHASNLRPAGP